VPLLPTVREPVESSGQCVPAEIRDERIAVWRKILEINRD